MNAIVNKILLAGDEFMPMFTTQEVNKLTSENFTSRLAQANLASKNDIVNFVKQTDFDDKLKTLNKKLIEIKQSKYLFKMN